MSQEAEAQRVSLMTSEMSRHVQRLLRRGTKIMAYKNVA